MATIEDTYNDVMQAAWHAASDEGRKFIQSTGPQAHRRGGATVRWVGELHDVVHRLVHRFYGSAG